MEAKKSAGKQLLGVLKLSVKEFSENKGPKLSASLAYYTVFSLGPLLVVIISICSIFFGQEAVEGQVYAQLAGFVGDDTARELQEVIRNASLAGKSKMAAIIGGAALLLGATTVFAEIQDSINSIWDLRSKPKSGILSWLRKRVLSFSVIISLGFLLLVSLAISTVIDAIGENLKARFPDASVVIFYIINLLITFIITTAIFAVIFKVLPDAVIKWKDVRGGAIATALLFIIGKFLISLYVSQAKVGSTYGAAGSLVVLLVWVYYSAMILYFGASVTRAYAGTYGTGIKPKEYAELIED